ncbi:hypothetical protein RFM23_24910 [Mesorhizobium abyssinicae]|uniref:MarR family transcriptional regulator n=1 Tax=Mesorhizobium abyssinicae TaxID=1209958 RepID=A0ABU5AU82_9HYPH|nr:hypothetical protein [Mesorhizobium abyssinicae]MDX8540862.1 hypothetical protein [Mesorhizobium abyssinicae]
MDEAAKDLRALRFVADMTRKLAKMLSRTRHHMLVYFLEMTAVEAETLADAQDPKLTRAQKAPEPKN